jgi:hypothetical protein
MAFNVLAARRAGATDEQIAQVLAEETGVDYKSLVDKGATAEQIINAITFEDLSFGEAFMAGARAEAGSEFDGISQIFGGELDPEQVAQENLAQQAYEERGVATTLGRLAGGLLNPSTLLPGSMLFKGWRGAAAAGTLAGGVGGAVRPLYEEDESRLTSGLIGAGAGAVLGGTIGALATRLSRNAAKVDVDGGDAAPPGAVKGVDEEGNPIIQEGEIETPPASATEPDIKPTIEPDPVVQQEEVFNLPVIPQDLGRPQPRFGKAQIQWETDLDNLLYTVGNPASKSKRHDDYVAYLQQALKLPEQDVLKLAKQVRDEVIQTGKDTLKEAALKGQQDVASFQFKMSKALDNHFFPVTKGLDEPSTFVYNYGKAMMPDVKGKVSIGQLNMRSPQIQQLISTVKTIDPQATTADIFGAARGYSIILDTMKNKLGRQFKPRSFEDVYANKLDEDSWRNLYDNGNFDGCP